MIQWLDRQSLEEGCSISGTGGIRPHATQGLLGMRTFLKSFWERQHPSYGPGRVDSLIVLALDGIGFDVAEAAWSADMIAPITSTFPSTSSTAWLSSTTGLSVDEHIVPGVVYYREDLDALFNCLYSYTLTQQGDSYERQDRSDLEIGSWPTIFDELSASGVDCVANLGDMCSLPGHWAHAVVHGARETKPKADWELIRFHPRKISEALVAEVDQAIENRRRGCPIMIWSHLNIDEYIHLYGYDDAVIDFLRRIEKAVEVWTRDGHSVIAYSDHGLVPTRSSRRLVEAWESVNVPSLCRLPPGGAGRVLWSYPRSGLKEEVMARLKERLAGHALVIYSEELEGMGLMRMNEKLQTSIGAVTVLATGEEFPIPGSGKCRFEHGSFTPMEMMAVLAIWRSF